MDELGKLLYITDIGFYPNAEFHYRKRSKAEALQYVFIYCIEGSGWIESAHQRQKVVPNQFVILPKGEAHAYGSELNKVWTIYWIHFDGESAGLLAEGIQKPTSINPENDSRIQERLLLFEEIYATLKNGYSKNNLHYSSTCLFHFLGSLKYLGAYRESASTNQIQADLTEKAIHFMRENTHRKLAIKEVADYVGWSVSHFSSSFHKKTGFSPVNYYSQLKIQQACHYLDFTDFKINQIALTLGMADPLYFSRIFTKTMGISPSKYRDKKKG